MNKKIIFKGLAIAIAVGSMASFATSCSDDYLDLAPITDVSKNDVATTLDGARFSMQGMCSSMYSQRRNGGWNNTCGEPYYNIMYGEALGNTFHDRIWNVYAASISNWTQMRNANGNMTTNYMWSYAYSLINCANQILDGIDEIPVSTEEELNERNGIKAVALAIRAHSYIKLTQVYGPRWADSNNGTVNSGVVLRLKSGVDDVPFSPMNEVLDQIYADCDESIKLFNESKYDRGLIWVPNVNVAHGLKARAAALKNDWATVRSEAKLARAGHEIMSAHQYAHEGFIMANQEYLWATWFQSEGMYYDGHGGTYSCNGWAIWSWGVSSGIDFDLYRVIPSTDVRKGMYFAPGFFSLEENKEIAEECGVDDDSFFNPTMVDAATVRINASENQSLNDASQYVAIDDTRWPDNNSGMAWSSSFSDGNPYPYLYGAYLVAGLQYKFWSVDTFGTNQFPYMRASEMAYLEAEAAYMQGDESAAQAIMVEINLDKRDPEFTCTETGEDLLQKIRDYRHIELWGEGFTWFDLKRWNIPMVRNAWVANDNTSGNYQKNLAGTYATDYKEGWRVSVPNNEFSYNKAVHVEELPSNNR